MSVEIPNGLTPPDCVYRYIHQDQLIDTVPDHKLRTCWIPAMCRVIYSTVTGSSTVKRWLWHSIRALSIKTRPSAVSPAFGVNSLRSLRYNTYSLTSKRKAYMVIQHDDLADGSRVLKLQNRLLLDTKDDNVLAPYTDLCGE